MATIYDVARIAGVSKSTVSRVINGSARVSPETTMRVNQAIHRTGFRPNHFAQGINRGKTRTIGVVIHGQKNSLHTDPFHGRVFSGIVGHLEKCAYHLLYAEVQSDEQLTNYIESVIRDRRVDGTIVVGQGTRKEVEQIKDEKLPFVLIDDDFGGAGVNAVVNDNFGAGRLVGKFLWQRGFRNIAYCTGFNAAGEPVASFRGRFLGLRSCVEEHGGRFDPKLEVYGDSVQGQRHVIEVGRECGEKILGLSSLPDAVCAANDFMAIGCIRVLREHGVRVPEDISVVGFDDIELGQHFEPALTTVRMATDTMGIAAVERLIDLVEGRKVTAPMMIVFPVELIERHSVSNKS